MSNQSDENEEKINVRERLTDNLLDLSLMNISKIPVEDIKALRRATILDLSNNRITLIESNFTDLTQLTQLDLSKNRITSMCDDFGLLTNLRRLDLYNNQITRLPLTFGRLRNLKYLDLKNNPLNPAFKKIIGTCSDTNDCLVAAWRAVDLMKHIERRVVEGRIQAREQREDAERVVEEQRKKEQAAVEGNSTDDSKQDKSKRKRKLDANSALSTEDSNSGGVAFKKETNARGFGIPLLLWILLLILLAAAALLYSTHFDTVRTMWNEALDWSHENIREEYIK